MPQRWGFHGVEAQYFTLTNLHIMSTPPTAHEPLLKWVHLETSLSGRTPEYLVQIGINPHYYEQRIPPCLKNGTQVKFFPVLFQVGVDIRQWGAHAGSHVKSQFAGDASAGNAGLLDDEDDKSISM